MAVHVLIPVHNRVDTTMECLDSIYAQDYADFRVVVVDDGSTDGTSERVREKYPQTELLKGDGSLWWTGAMHMGVEHILKTAGKDDFILALNDDVTFDHDYMSCLVRDSIANGRAMTASLCVMGDGDYYFVDGGRLEWRYFSTRLNMPMLAVEDGPPETIRDLDFLFSHGTLIPVEVFHRVGNFNYRDLPHYGGDTEFSHRAGEAGFGLIVSTSSPLSLKLDSGHTGLHYSDTRYISFRRAWQILFSIRSSFQLKTKYKLLDLICPRKYRFANKVLFTIKFLRVSLFLTLPFVLPKLVVKYLFRPFPVPDREFRDRGLDVEALYGEKVVRKLLFRGQEHYSFTVPYETVRASGDPRLEELYRSSLRFGKKLTWFYQAMR